MPKDEAKLPAQASALLAQMKADIEELARYMAEVAHHPLQWHEMTDATCQRFLDAARTLVVVNGWRREPQHQESEP